MPRKIEKVALYSGELPKALFWKRGSRKADEPSFFRALSPGQIPDMRMLNNKRLPCQLPVATRGCPQMNHGKIKELEHLVEDLRKNIKELQLKNLSLTNSVEKFQRVRTKKKAEMKNLKMEVQTLRQAACDGACHRGLDRKRVENSRERVTKRREEREMYSDEMYTETKVDKQTKQDIDKRKIGIDSLREKEKETRSDVEERDNMKRHRDKLQCEIKGLKSELLQMKMKREKAQEKYEKDKIKARQDEERNTTESQCRAGKRREVLGRGEMERRLKEQSLEKQREHETQRGMERREEELTQREAGRQKERPKALDTEGEDLQRKLEREHDRQRDIDRQRAQRREKEMERQRELERESEDARQKEDLQREIERLEENVIQSDIERQQETERQEERKETERTTNI
ncbi:trichohyalin-like isoform X2 [Osmerus eperlanus]|uniref:trichohyalin-like isoform X2 n=1 Tax=Osmerus eperlanus TaxID=29151 RepID=UPI002E110825